MFIFIDTAVKGCNVALADECGVIAVHQEPIERGHAEHILPIFERLLSDHGKNSADIDRVFVTVGPGSFTGLRVGLTVARFIGFSLGVPVSGMTSFQAFSFGVNDDRDRVVLVETKRSDYYVQVLSKEQDILSEPQSISMDHILHFVSQYPDAVITGDAVDRFVEENGGMNGLFQQDMIDLDAVIMGLSKGGFQSCTPDAFYIRDADVSKPKKKILKS